MKRHILTTTVVLLTLSCHISAQNRSAQENLAGLSGIGLIVRYGHEIDGLPEAMRPTMLLILQDRARDLLKAEVPLLESTDEAGMVGKPRLQFTVTLRKQTATAPAIVVDSRLYERVRLWRDHEKEMELATWVWGGIGGPKVTSKMLFDVFDQQIDGFVKAYRAANSKPPQIESRTPEPAPRLRDNANALEGLNGISVFVWSGPSLSVDERTEALLKMLQSEAEKRFKQAGIPLLRYADETKPAGSPLLYVSIRLSEPNSSPAILVENRFWQQVRPLRDPRKEIRAVTWESGARENGPITDEAVLKVMNRQLDDFIKAYNSANPKLSSASN